MRRWLALRSLPVFNLDNGLGATPAVAPAPAPETAPAGVPAPEAPKAPEPVTNLLADAPKEPVAPDPAKPAEPAAEIKPESYLESLKLPDGTAKDDALLTAFLDGAAKSGMDQKSVQAIVDAMGPKLQAQLNAPREAWNTLQSEWQTKLKEHPEIGGAKLDGAVKTINQALAQTGVLNDDLKQALVLTGAGNNPHIVHAFYKLASAFSEGGPVTGAPTGQTAAKNPASLLYPSTAPTEG